MERANHPQRLFHGTPYEIHSSERPFLDPRLAAGLDEDDPKEGHVFATPDLLLAKIFAFKESGCRNIVKTDHGPLIVFEKPPKLDEGFVYEVPPEGFKQTIRRGQPSGKWAMVESDMPLIKNVADNEVPGIPLGEPIRRVTIRGLIEQEHLRICVLTGAIDIDTYLAAVRDAIHEGLETIFMREAIARGWLRDITDSISA